MTGAPDERGSGRDPDDPGRARSAAEVSGLIVSGRPLLVMLSGGADSICLLDIAVELGADVAVLHVNYGLRGEESDADERHCAAVCDRLRVPLVVEHVELATAAEGAPGNLQAEARERRYALAELHARGDYATGHTLSDQAETVLMRLASSPGRRALLGMAARRGRLVRPLLGATRSEAEAHCRSRELGWRTDRTNREKRFARARVRAEVMPALASVSSSAERNIAMTAALLRDEAEVLEDAVTNALARLGPAPSLAGLSRERPALARLVVRALAEAAAGRGVAIPAAQVERILALAETPGSISIDVGHGLRAVSEYGRLRLVCGPAPESPEPVRLPIPGKIRFGEWVVSAAPGALGDVSLSAEPLGGELTVRAWREGDRMRPAGSSHTKSLQDLFTDRKIPRELRRTLPVIEAGAQIAWVAGVAVGEGFEAGEGEIVGLSARLPSGA